MISRRDELADNLTDVQTRISNSAKSAGRISDDVTLIAVTKTYPASDVKILHDLGLRNFAENRDHEGREKSQIVPATWHFQGQIQSNKIVSIVSWASVIHSLDSSRHLALLKRAVPESKAISIFLQVCLDAQPGRGGLPPEEIYPLAELVMQDSHFVLDGLMAVAPLGEDPESAFARLARIHSDFRQQFPAAGSLSAGMSGDFEVAIKHGATHIRVGSSILGSRT